MTLPKIFNSEEENLSAKFWWYFSERKRDIGGEQNLHPAPQICLFGRMTELVIFQKADTGEALKTQQKWPLCKRHLHLGRKSPFVRAPSSLSRRVKGLNLYTLLSVKMALASACVNLFTVVCLTTFPYCTTPLPRPLLSLAGEGISGDGLSHFRGVHFS